MKRKEFIRSAAILGALPLMSWSNNFKTEPDNVAPDNGESDNAEPVLSSPDLNNSYWYIGHLMSIIISSKQTNGAFSLIHGYEIPGLEPPPHTHTREDESFYLLAGEIEFTVGEKLLNAKAGDWVFLPRNIQHSFQVKSEKAEVLIHLSPGGFEDYFIEMSEPATEMVIPIRPEGPPDVQKIIETASRFGIVFPKRN